VKKNIELRTPEYRVKYGMSLERRGFHRAGWVKK
jgi:hypothetical protein